MIMIEFTYWKRYSCEILRLSVYIIKRAGSLSFYNLTAIP